MTNSETGRALFLKHGSFVKKGDKIFNPLLGSFFKKLSQGSHDDLYSGSYAQQIAQDMANSGGFVTVDDLCSYQVIERQPLSICYRGYDVITNPPPSSGGILIGLYLSILDKYELTGFDPLGFHHIKILLHGTKIFRVKCLKTY